MATNVFVNPGFGMRNEKPTGDNRPLFFDYI